MIEIKHKNRTYKINKEKLIKILSKLNSSEIKESEIEILMEKFNLYEEYFLKQINYL